MFSTVNSYHETFFHFPQWQRYLFKKYGLVFIGMSRRACGSRGACACLVCHSWRCSGFWEGWREETINEAVMFESPLHQPTSWGGVWLLHPSRVRTAVIWDCLFWRGGQCDIWPIPKYLYSYYVDTASLGAQFIANISFFGFSHNSKNLDNIRFHCWLVTVLNRPACAN